LRRQFWQLVTPIALAVKDRELAAGLDAQGEPLKLISARTRKNRRSAMTPSGKGDPSAPPLMPAYQKSRVRSLLAGRAFATHCELYWRYDPFTGASFDVILTYQKAMGRDVFGLSDLAMAKIKSQSWAAWAKWRKAGLAPTEKRSAFPAAALTAGPQSRIAGIIARSAEPNAGATAPKAVGSLSTRWITRGIGEPKVILKAPFTATRSGAMTGPDWRRFFTAEEGGGKPPRAPKPKAPKPAAPKVARVAMKPAPPKPEPSRALMISDEWPLERRERFQSVLNSIDRVHTVGDLRAIPVVKDAADEKRNGSFVYENGEAKEIRLKTSGPTIELTLVHERGHHLEMFGLPTGDKGQRNWDYEETHNGFMAGWMEAVSKTDAFSALADLEGKRTAEWHGQAVAVDEDYLSYLTGWDELWARSYAQYITAKTQHPELLAQLAHTRSTAANPLYYHRQWSDEDFRPIEAAIDQLFRGLGWLK